MRIRVPYLAAALVLLATPAFADIQINVDKTAQTLTVSRDGKLLHTWPVSTGRTGRFTPAGDYRAFRMEKDHYSQEFDDAPMPYSIFFTKRGHAIHGSYDTKKLGRPASGGCVRLAPENARVLFDLVQAEGVLKTKVSVSGDERVAIARASREPAARDARAERVNPVPPQFANEPDPRLRQRYATPAPQYQQPQYQQPQYAPQYQQPAQQQQQFYYDGYQWRPVGGAQVYRQPYEPRGYQPAPYYYQPRPGYYQD